MLRLTRMQNLFFVFGKTLRLNRVQNPSLFCVWKNAETHQSAKSVSFVLFFFVLGKMLRLTRMQNHFLFCVWKNAETHQNAKSLSFVLFFCVGKNVETHQNAKSLSFLCWKKGGYSPECKIPLFFVMGKKVYIHQNSKCLFCLGKNAETNQNAKILSFFVIGDTKVACLNHES